MVKPVLRFPSCKAWRDNQKKRFILRRDSWRLPCLIISTTFLVLNATRKFFATWPIFNELDLRKLNTRGCLKSQRQPLFIWVGDGE